METVGGLTFAVPTEPVPRVIDLGRTAFRVAVVGLVAIALAFPLRAWLAGLAERGDVAGVQRASLALVALLYAVPPALVLLRRRPPPPKRPEGVPESTALVRVFGAKTSLLLPWHGWVWSEGGALVFRGESYGFRLTADAIRSVRRAGLELAAPPGAGRLALHVLAPRRDLARFEAMAGALAPGEGSVLPALWRETPTRIVGVWTLGGVAALLTFAALLIFAPRRDPASLAAAPLLLGFLAGPGLLLAERSARLDRSRAVARFRATLAGRG